MGRDGEREDIGALDMGSESLDPEEERAWGDAQKEVEKAFSTGTQEKMRQHLPQGFLDRVPC